MRQILYKCDVCGKEYKYDNIQAVDSDRGILLRLPELKVEICVKCKRELLKMIQALKQSYVSRG